MEDIKNIKHEEHKHCNCHGHEHGDEQGHCHQHEHEQKHEHEHGSEHCHCHNHEHEHCCEHEHETNLCALCGMANDKCKCERQSNGAKKHVYILEGLGCANCAAKMESKLKELQGVENLTITFATKQLMVLAKDPDSLLPAMKTIIDSIEDGVTIIPKESKKVLKYENEDNRKDLFSIIAGGILFIIGILFEHVISVPEIVTILVLVVGYLILGGNVLLTALKNIVKGKVFDENFLMSIATIGAFLIGDYPEAVGVMLFYRVGEYFENRATAKSRKQIMEAIDLRPEVVNLYLNGEIKTIDANDAKVGDILLVRPGDRIPLDAIVVSGESRVDTSPVTGESVPIKVAEGDSVLSGCINTSGQLMIKVEKVLGESMVSRILDSVENAVANKPEIDKFITRFARVYTPLVVLAALIVAIGLPFILPDWHFFVNEAYVGVETVVNGATGIPSIFTALTFLVISCPCALVLSVPLAFFSGIGAASKKGILFKGGNVIEALSNIKAVVMDKTGTVTKGNFVVQEIVSLREDISKEELLSLSASCEMYSTHPIAASIINNAEENNIKFETPKNIKEIPGHGIIADVSKGEILCGNVWLMESNNVDIKRFAGSVGQTEVLIALNKEFVGYIVIADTIKEDAKGAINKIKAKGIVTAMLTGDALETAKAVALETGIDECYGKLLPEDKLSKLAEIRRKHGAVMFVGDGINDAPVLAGADVGAAMGSGADATIEAADIVFMNSEMEAIPKAVEIAGYTKRISRQNVYFALIIKFLIMALGIAGYGNMWLAVFADTGVSMICLLNSIRILKK